MNPAERDKLQFVMHELSNLLTGILVSGGLLRQQLNGDRRQHHAQEVCEAGERSAALVREARFLLTSPEERLQEMRTLQS